MTYIKNFLDQPHVKELIAANDLLAVYKLMDKFNRQYLSTYLLGLGINPADYFEKEIPDGAFYNCKSLTNVVIPYSVTIISKSLFSNCINLTSVTIPDSVTKIDAYAFNHCEGLKSLDIPDSVATIGEFAFYWCSKLIDITIPSSVINIGEYAFASCDSLTAIGYKGTQAQWRKIKKERNWRYESTIKVIHCIDGDIELK